MDVGPEQRAVRRERRLDDAQRSSVLNAAAAVVPARTRPDDPVVEEGVVAEGRGAEVRDASTFGHGHVPGERVSDEGVVSSPGLLARLRLRPRRLAYGHRPAIELGLESSTAELGGRVICERALRDSGLAAERLARVTLGGLVFDGAALQSDVADEPAGCDGQLTHVVVVDCPTTGRRQGCVVAKRHSSNRELRAVDDRRSAVWVACRD